MTNEQLQQLLAIIKQQAAKNPYFTFVYDWGIVNFSDKVVTAQEIMQCVNDARTKTALVQIDRLHFKVWCMFGFKFGSSPNSSFCVIASKAKQSQKEENKQKIASALCASQ